MTEVWNVYPKKGLGPLQFGMTHEQVAQFNDIMGCLDETTEEILPGGRVALNEFRDRGAPLCSFENGILTHIGIGESDIVEARFHDLSVFNDDPKRVYSALGQEAGEVFWHRHSVIMPSLCLELAGFVMEYSPKGEPPVFESKAAGFTWPRLMLFAPDQMPFEAGDLIEIANRST